MRRLWARGMTLAVVVSLCPSSRVLASGAAGKEPTGKAPAGAAAAGGKRQRPALRAAPETAVTAAGDERRDDPTTKLRLALERRLGVVPVRAPSVGASCPPDPFEEDDSPAAAGAIAPPNCQDRNHCEDATDWVSFTAIAGGRYTIVTCNFGFSSDTLIRLYDPVMTLIGQDDNGGGCDFGSSGINFVAAQSGTYLIEVTQADGSFGVDRDYVLCLDGGCLTPDAFEEDDDASQASPIAIGECQDHDHCDDFSDWLSFPVVAGRTYTLETCNLGAVSDTQVFVYDSRLGLVDGADDGGSCDPLASQVVFTATETATWYADVRHLRGRAGYERQYQVCLTSGCAVADGFEEDDTAIAARPIAPLECQDHNHCDDVEDWQSFVAVAGANYLVQTCNDGFAGDTLVRVFDPTMTQIAEDDNSGTCAARSSELTFTAAQAGTHFIEVTQADGASGTGREYSVCLYGGCTATDVFEDDDEPLSATPIPLNICEDRNHCDDASDWLRLPVNIGQQYTVQTCNTGANADTSLALYDSGLQLLALDDSSGSCDGGAAGIAFTATETTQWYLEVRSYAGRFGNGFDYQVCFDPGCALADDNEDDDTPAAAVPTVAGECPLLNHCDDGSDWLRFDASPGDPFVVDTCNFGFSSDTRVRVYDPTFTLISESDDGGGCDTFASFVGFTAAQAGTYLIEVVQADGGSGVDRDYFVCLWGGCTVADSFEDDDGSAGARPIALGECQSHTHCEDASDWLTFPVALGERYTVETCDLGAESDTTLRLYDSSLGLWARDDDGGSCDDFASAIAFTATETASWFVEVGQYANRIGAEREYRVCLRAGGASSALLRDWLTSLGPPPMPAKASVLPLDPVLDVYRDPFASGSVDPQTDVITDLGKRLVFYAVGAPGNVLRVVKDAGQVRIFF